MAAQSFNWLTMRADGLHHEFLPSKAEGCETLAEPHLVARKATYCFPCYLEIPKWRPRIFVRLMQKCFYRFSVHAGNV